MQKNLVEVVFSIKNPVSILVSTGSQNNPGTCSLGHLREFEAVNPVNTHNSAVKPGCFVPCNTGRGDLSPQSVFAKLENSNLARG